MKNAKKRYYCAVMMAVFFMLGFTVKSDDIIKVKVNGGAERKNKRRAHRGGLGQASLSDRSQVSTTSGVIQKSGASDHSGSDCVDLS